MKKKLEYQLSSDYEMNFSSDDGNNNKENDRHKTGKRGNNGGRGYISVIILALVFVVVVALMLYFFAFRTNTIALAFSSNAITYRLDADGDGKADDLNADGSLNWTALDSDASLSVLDEENPHGNVIVTNPDSSLVPIFLDPEYYGLTLQVIQSNLSQNTIYLQGTFQIVTTAANGRQNTNYYSFSFAIDREQYTNYIVQIVERDTYFDSTNHYQSGLESTSDVSSWLIPLIFGILVIGLIVFFFNRMSKSVGSGGNPMGGFVNNVARKESSSKVRFADVAGCDECKAELVEMVDYFHATDKYTRLGAKLPHGVLLVGPPGTGKTLLAKAVAGEANVPFYSISGSDFVEMYVGVGAARVRSLFKTAKSNAPCLIFIDEIDAVGRQRGAGLGGGNDEREQTLNELLIQMDGFSDNSGIIVMAATNRDDVLDPALTRPGRFDRKITVDLPDKAGRAAILKVHSRNKKLASDVNFDDIASRTVGFSGADLANIMNDAAILAVRANRSAITTIDIDEAIDRAISGPAKKSHLEPAERKQVAYHESGHAVIGIFLPYSDVVQKITIIPRGRTGGHVLMTPEKDRFLLTKNQMMARITGYLGGRTSEEIFFGDVSTGASNDIEVATQLARSMVTQYGMSDLGPIQYERPNGSVFLGRDYNSVQSNYSTQIAFEIDKAVRAIIDECHEKARQLLEEHRDDVELIANTLIEHETITADQIDYLLKNRHLPEVDEHTLKTADGLNPNNPHNIILYPGYEPFYIATDNILKGQPSLLALAVSSKDGKHISKEEFRDICVSRAADPSKIGMLFIDAHQAERISLSVETFASHIETYAGVPVLLFVLDEDSCMTLKKTFEVKQTITDGGEVNG